MRCYYVLAMDILNGNKEIIISFKNELEFKESLKSGELVGHYDVTETNLSEEHRRQLDQNGVGYLNYRMAYIKVIDSRAKKAVRRMKELSLLYQ